MHIVPAIWENKAGVQGQPGQHSEALISKNKIKD
jgi:hypothetical protein